MDINWFEGGRRINALLMWIVGIVGAGYVVLSGSGTVYLFSASPDQPWHFAPKECEYPNEDRFMWKREFPQIGNKNLSLCFETVQGDVLYAEAPPPKDAPPPPITFDRGNLRPPPPNKWYWHGGTYSEEVRAYMDKREADFVLTPMIASHVRDGLWRLRWARFKNRVEEAAPVVGAALLFLWLFCAVAGWIIRGFAGIQSGKDFRPRPPTA